MAYLRLETWLAPGGWAASSPELTRSLPLTSSDRGRRNSNQESDIPAEEEHPVGPCSAPVSLASFFICRVQLSDRTLLLHFRHLSAPGIRDQLNCLEQRGFWVNSSGGAIVLESLPIPPLKQAGKTPMPPHKQMKTHSQEAQLLDAISMGWWAGYRKGSNKISDSGTPEFPTGALAERAPQWDALSLTMGRIFVHSDD